MPCRQDCTTHSTASFLDSLGKPLRECHNIMNFAAQQELMELAAMTAGTLKCRVKSLLCVWTISLVDSMKKNRFGLF